MTTTRVCILALDTIGDLVIRQPLFCAICDAGHELAVVVRASYAPILPMLEPRAMAVTTHVEPFRPRTPAEELEFLRKTLSDIESFGAQWLVAAAFTRTFADEWLLRNAAGSRRAGYLSDGVGSRLTGAFESLAQTVALPLDRMLDLAVEVDEESREADKARKLAGALAELALPPLGAPRMRIEQPDKDRADEVLASLGLRDRFAVMAPAGTANNALKALPVELARDAIRHLASAHRMPTLVMGVASERAHMQATADGLDEARIWIGDPGDIPLMVALVARAAVYVGADTGPMHVALANDVPAVAVFGGGHWPRFAPESPKSIVVRNVIPCYGCQWNCRWNRPLCIDTVQSAYLLRGIDAALSGSGTPAIMDGAAAETLNVIGQAIATTTEVLRVRTSQLEGDILALHGRLAASDDDRLARGRQIDELTVATREAASQLTAKQRELEAAHAHIVEIDEDRRARGRQIEELTGMVREANARSEDLHRQVREVNAAAERMSGELHALHSSVESAQSRAREAERAALTNVDKLAKDNEALHRSADALVRELDAMLGSQVTLLGVTVLGPKARAAALRLLKRLRELHG
jgi:ADP-heptose:LPS heptosyltransferase